MTSSNDQPSSRNPASPDLGFDDRGANDPDPRHSSRDLRGFVGQVQQRTGLEREEEAERLTRATLRKLGECVSSGQARELSATLPPELETELISHSTKQARSFDKGELIDQISGEVHSVDAEQVEARSASS